ncbi:GntP family permease [Romboutsia sp. 1001713B170207_170306_H8]|uniref:GntP family permease n=1 Tax=Romboutsia sp. 1001713B170207_170306_H8 TaxID=2787112 RepID=UPI000822C480|nr:GntP family permease [Romboutsia sp. 1001713B170207_170306_H8]SCH64585.1 H+/gluconate symporter and related permeases [uncultured Clostridium sp.]
MIGMIGLILSLSLIIILAYKGYSTIITAPLVALLTVLIIGGESSTHLMVHYTEIYMGGFSNFVKNYFPIFLTGAIFAKLMEEVMYAKSIANFITNNLGKDKTILAVVLAGALLTYGGVSLFTVAFVLYPIANVLFKESNIPKRLIPGTIALGAFTFTMTALPGTPEIQNVIPMRYFGTDTFSAPLIGIVASLLMLTLGMTWLTYRVKKAELNLEGYGNHFIENSNIDSKDPPNIFVALAPILIIFTSNLFFSKVFYKLIDGSYLNKYNLTLDNVSGTWSVIISIVIAISFIILLNFKKISNLNNVINGGISNSFLPLLSSSAIVGYGSVIKSLPVFITLQSIILHISSNPIVSEALSVNIICGITASASGGLTITLDSLAHTFIAMSNTLNISPQIMHRIASLASGGLDTLPHNGAVITTLAICGLTHKDSYKDIFITSVLIPIFVTTIIVIVTSIYYT